MTQDDARRVELVRAVETEDREHALLTAEDRRQADLFALSEVGEVRDHKGEARFIATRAQFASTRLATRHPGVAALLAKARWPRWLGWALPLLALIAGFVANELGTDRRLDLLAVPLLGTLAWNLFVYAWVLVAAVSGHGVPSAGLFVRLAGRQRPGVDDGGTLQRATDTFRQSWARLSAPLAGARIARTLHCAAALFACGLIGGIYLRALVIEYRAGWESTFLNPAAVHAVLSAVLGPASLISGVALPPVGAISAMRWGADQVGGRGGVNAGPWIHLYTVTIAGLVIAPRLLLAFWQGLRVWRLGRAFPMAGREDFYLRRLLRAATGRAGVARITPYAYHTDDATRRGLANALRRALGDGAQPHFDAPVDYGKEDRWLETHAADPGNDYHILLFTLSATPEEENHGAFAAALASRIARDQPGTTLAALIDETPYRAHFAGQAGLDDRIATRLASWRQVLSKAGIVLLGIDLAASDDDALAQRIESGLLRDGALQ